MHFGSISRKPLAHPHVARNVMLKFQNKLTSSFSVFAPTRKRDAGQNPGATKIPLPLRVGYKKSTVKGLRNAGFILTPFIYLVLALIDGQCAY